MANFYTPWDNDARRIFIDTTQAYGALREARDDLHELPGTVRWKTVDGREYLYRELYKRNTSLGPRSPETEAIFENYRARKPELVERVKSLQRRVDYQARMARAANLDRVPALVANLAAELNVDPALRGKVVIVGTTALYAYEARAAVTFVPEMVATRDVDILWDTRRELELAGDIAESGLIGLLQRLDPTFKRQRGQERFRATNSEGFAVDLLTPEGLPPAGDLRMSPLPGDLVAQQIWGLDELLSPPAISQVVIGHLGKVVTEMAVPDPRAFVQHKLALSRQLDREATKRRRDAQVAEAVMRLLLDVMVDLPVTKVELERFDTTVRRELEKTLAE